MSRSNYIRVDFGTGGQRGRSIVTGLILVIGLTYFVLTFWAEVSSAIMTWTTSSAYNHCFLVLPIVLFLVWDRRGELQGTVIQPDPLFILFAVPVGVGWLVAERLGVMEGRQIMAVTLLELLLLSLLGRQGFAKLSGPLLYLYFLVPFGEFMVPWLQDITAAFIRCGVILIGIPAYIDGYVIEIPEGTFYVAEACAGLRFLIAAVSYGVLYALLMYRSLSRRVLFIVASAIIPVVANGFRALGIVVLGHLLGSADAAAADHVIYGWGFFSLVILILTGVGLPYREDQYSGRVRALGVMEGSLPWMKFLSVLVGAMVTFSLGPLSAALIFRETEGRELDLSSFPSPEGCYVQALNRSDDLRLGEIGDHVRIECGTNSFSLTMKVFPSSSSAGQVIAAYRRVIESSDPGRERNLVGLSVGGSESVWTLVCPDEEGSCLLAAIWIGGKTSGTGLMARLRQAIESLRREGHSPAIIAIRVVPSRVASSSESKDEGRVRLVEFARQLSDLDLWISAQTRSPERK